MENDMSLQRVLPLKMSGTNWTTKHGLVGAVVRPVNLDAFVALGNLFLWFPRFQRLGGLMLVQMALEVFRAFELFVAFKAGPQILVIFKSFNIRKFPLAQIVIYNR